MVTVFRERENETSEHDFSGKIKDLLAEIGVNKETIVVTKNGEVVSEDEPCEGKDELKLLSVISGG